MMRYTPARYAPIMNDVLGGRRILTFRQIERWFFEHGYKGPLHDARGFSAYLRDVHHWSCRYVTNHLYVYCPASTTNAEIELFRRSYDAEGDRQVKDESFIVRQRALAKSREDKEKSGRIDRRWIGWIDLYDYVRAAAKACGTVPNSAWYGVGQPAGAKE